MSIFLRCGWDFQRQSNHLTVSFGDFCKGLTFCGIVSIPRWHENTFLTCQQCARQGEPGSTEQNGSGKLAEVCGLLGNLALCHWEVLSALLCSTLELCHSRNIFKEDYFCYFVDQGFFGRDLVLLLILVPILIMFRTGPQVQSPHRGCGNISR